MEIIVSLTNALDHYKKYLEKHLGTEFNHFEAFKIDPTDLSQKKEIDVPELWDAVRVRFK